MRSIHIPLVSRKYPGLFIIIDEADAELVLQYRWSPIVLPNGIYAETLLLLGRHVYLHRFITSAPDGFEVDHINGDRLDNRRSNLRLATGNQNAYNVGLAATNTSGYKGVSFCKQTQRWRAQIRANKSHINIGRYMTKEEAARAYDAAARRHHGDFARLNFPEGDERGVA
jgi:hypothetical protein